MVAFNHCRRMSARGRAGGGVSISQRLRLRIKEPAPNKRNRTPLFHMSIATRGRLWRPTVISLLFLLFVLNERSVE